MPLRTTTRNEGETPAVFEDRMVRCVMQEVGGAVEVWAEWSVQRANGTYRTVSVRCSPAAEAAILALSGIPGALDTIRDDTKSKVSP